LKARAIPAPRAERPMIKPDQDTIAIGMMKIIRRDPALPGSFKSGLFNNSLVCIADGKLIAVITIPSTSKNTDK